MSGIWQTFDKPPVLLPAWNSVNRGLSSIWQQSDWLMALGWGVSSLLQTRLAGAGIRDFLSYNIPVVLKLCKGSGVAEGFRGYQLHWATN